MSIKGSPITINDEELTAYGENVARLLQVDGKIRVSRISKQIHANIRRLGRQRAAMLEQYGASSKVPPAAEWLLDNYYLVRCEGIWAAQELSLVALPRSNNTAALISLCRSLIKSGRGAVTSERCKHFFNGAQLSYTLSRRELDMLVAALKAALIEEIAALYLDSTLTDEAAYLAKSLFTSLRELSLADFSDTLEQIDKVEQLLLNDPADIYPLMSDKSKSRYKKRVARLARQNQVSEITVAEAALSSARNASKEQRHVGFPLFGKPNDGSESATASATYIFVFAALSILVSAIIAEATDSTAAFFVLLLPVYEIWKLLIDRLLIAFIKPSHIPRMELEKGVPAEGRTICVISALLSKKDSGGNLAAKLEQYCLASRDCGENLLFGILADLPEADERKLEGDNEIIVSAKLAVDALNEKYNGGFFLFLREREYNEADGHYTAFERKRGAITALCNHIAGKAEGLRVISGTDLTLRGVHYILTLDEDTRLLPGAARQLIAAMLHPLNAPVLDSKRGRVVSGHGVIHPRMSTELRSVNRSAFSQIFAGLGGVDPYGSDVSEVYMDVFDSGGFAGKGILDISAYLSCLENKIPEGHVLSHDALEGAYLRGGYMSDVELSDTFPSESLSFFRRMHRWVRGDWQNLPWLFRRGKGLALIDRFRLFDSVRRSLMPPAFFLAFLLAFFFPSPGFTTAAAISLVCIGAELFMAFASNLLRREGTNCRIYSYVLKGIQSAYLRGMIKIAVIPFEAYVCLDATCRSIWRMLVSKKHLLEWVPASSLSGDGKALKYYEAMWIAPVSGFLTAFFAPSLVGKAVAVVWILSPLFAYNLSAPAKTSPPPSVSEHDYLIMHSKQMWSFFTDFCTPADHFLPPDNYQERPPVGIAHRTSPTNIGLCLLSCLAALDLGISSDQEALGIVENVLATMRRMSKWRGHLYNWYNTKTLKPLRPIYISTVDSGNLAVSLMILREGLLERGNTRLAEQCSDLLAPMSFAPLYDSKRRLFSIGYDLEKEILSQNCYDLFASEARTASFIAIIRREVPLKHWQSLSRALVQSDKHRGMVSWTGSMFEYLMPRLFFDTVEGSIIKESDRFCVEVQKARTKKLKLPWGISESAYYSLDPALNYKYKAHGCAALALKRGMDEELVISPYSSFLALCCGRKSAVKNLHAIEHLGGTGRYGLWEAIDLSEGRGLGKKGELVRCVMSHHLGMSLVAVANSLKGKIMQERLMRYPEVAAYKNLMEEKLPLCSTIMRRSGIKVKDKPPRSIPIYWEKHGSYTDFAAPVCGLLSNGIYNLMLTDSGASSASYKGITVYNPPSSAIDYRHGIDIFLKQGEYMQSILPDASMERNATSSWQLSFSGAKIDTVRSNIRSQILIDTSENRNGERRIISVSPSENIDELCELIVMFEPLLCPYGDYVNHPSFWKLGMNVKTLGDALIIRRIPRGEGKEVFLCFASTEQMEFSARRELVPGRGGILHSSSNFIPFPLGWLRDPLICARMNIRLKSGLESAVAIAIAVGNTENEAYVAAQKILTESTSESSVFLAELAVGLKMNEKQLELAMELLSTISFPVPSVYSKNDLWRFGISGERPLVCFEAGDDESLDTAEAYIKSHAFLSMLDHSFDLVFISDEGGDYMQPINSALRELIHKFDSEYGVFIVDKSDSPEALLKARALKRNTLPADKIHRYDTGYNFYSPIQSFPSYGWNEDQSFAFYVNQSLPPRSWGNMLTNGRFGYFATDCGTGHMWYDNAREYQISPWLCDSLTTSGAETLDLNEKSLFASPDDCDCKVSYGFGWAKWEKSINEKLYSLCSFVPRDTDARVFLIRGDTDEPVTIKWRLDLVLGSVGERFSGVSISYDDDVFTAERPGGPYPDEPFRVCSSGVVSGYTSNKENWFAGIIDNDLGSGQCLGLSIKSKLPFVLVCGCDDAEKLKSLCNPSAAVDALRQTKSSWNSAVTKISIKTPLPGLDRLVNGWLPYQAIACRIMGRCSIYQSGGAFGYRDQLQDAVNLILLDSSFARSQIIECCRMQYSEGDVMHWWHKTGRATAGVRTRCSDDLLWLPWAVCEYVEKTGDNALCSMRTKFLSSEPLKDDEHDRFEPAVFSDDEATVLEHCKLALDRALTRGAGEHGLLKIGSGDWNDGMSTVGHGGMGESVWLSWFFSHTSHRFAQLLSTLDDGDAKKYEDEAARFGSAANSAWDGDHYLRGYFDDGTPLGSDSQQECKIDSVSQSFAALCPEADKLRKDQALSSAVTRLYDEKSSIVKLLEPPFESSVPSPGYIQSYGPGFRENGGQYTHGSIFLISALLREGRSDEAIKLIEAILPDGRDSETYSAEPYVIAADVYSNSDCLGQAGWSWYTGSAAWLYRVVLEELLGLKLRGGKLYVEPQLPYSWGESIISLRSADGELREIAVSPKLKAADLERKGINGND